MATIDTALYDDYVARKLITKVKHPRDELYIYNYTPVAQFSRAWDDVTLQARGLIADQQGNIVARPFRKFFNFSEHTGADLHANQFIRPLPFDLPYRVTEKMDGSLGILYWSVTDGWALATRGSFASAQAQEGTAILHDYLMANPDFPFNHHHTYLFEIIYPQNRIVVDYGQRRDIVLLEVLDTETGAPVDMSGHYPWPTVESYPAMDIAELQALHRPNAEGFVLRFADGTRVKVKHDEYVRLHRILTNVSSKSIWDMLRNGESLESILDNIPDEFYDWVRKTEADLRAEFQRIEDYNRQKLADMPDFETRRDQAVYVAETLYPSILWNMIDGKDYDKLIWRYLKPEFARPFVEDIDA